MATVTRENIGQLHDKLIVKVSKDDYLPSFDKNLRNTVKRQIFLVLEKEWCLQV